MFLIYVVSCLVFVLNLVWDVRVDDLVNVGEVVEEFGVYIIDFEVVGLMVMIIGGMYGNELVGVCVVE